MDTKNKANQDLMVTRNTSLVLFLNAKGQEIARVVKIKKMAQLTSAMKKARNSKTSALAGISLLKHLLQAKDEDVRANAVSFLKQVSEKDQVTLLREIRAILDDPRERHQTVINAAAFFAKAAPKKEAWLKLSKIVDDLNRQRSLRGLCVELLAQVDPQAASDLIRKLYADKEYGMEFYLVTASGYLGEHVKKELPRILTNLSGDRAYHVQVRALRALGRLGIHAEPGLAELRAFSARLNRTSESDQGVPKSLIKDAQLAIKRIEAAIQKSPK